MANVTKKMDAFPLPNGKTVPITLTVPEEKLRDYDYMWNAANMAAKSRYPNEFEETVPQVATGPDINKLTGADKIVKPEHFISLDRPQVKPPVNPAKPTLAERARQFLAGPQKAWTPPGIIAGPQQSLQETVDIPTSGQPWQARTASTLETAGTVLGGGFAPEMGANPKALLRSLIPSYLGSKGAEAVAGAVNASPETQRLASDVGGFAGATAGASPAMRSGAKGFLSSIYNNPPEVKRFGPAGMLGAALGFLTHPSYTGMLGGSMIGGGAEAALEGTITGLRGAKIAAADKPWLEPGVTSALKKPIEQAPPKLLTEGSIKMPPAAEAPIYAHSTPSPIEHPPLALPAPASTEIAPIRPSGFTMQEPTRGVPTVTHPPKALPASELISPTIQLPEKLPESPTKTSVSSTAAKPVTVKPPAKPVVAEVKPAEKPVEVKPAEEKPIAEAKPAETSVTETKPAAEEKPVVETKPATETKTEEKKLKLSDYVKDDEDIALRAAGFKRTGDRSYDSGNSQILWHPESRTWTITDNSGRMTSVDEQGMRARLKLTRTVEPPKKQEERQRPTVAAPKKEVPTFEKHKDAILDFVKKRGDVGTNSASLAAQYGVPKSEVDAGLKKLQQEGTIHRSGANWKYGEDPSKATEKASSTEQQNQEPNAGGKKADEAKNAKTVLTDEEKARREKVDDILKSTVRKTKEGDKVELTPEQKTELVKNLPGYEEGSNKVPQSLMAAIGRTHGTEQTKLTMNSVGHMLKQWGFDVEDSKIKPYGIGKEGTKPHQGTIDQMTQLVMNKDTILKQLEHLGFKPKAK